MSFQQPGEPAQGDKFDLKGNPAWIGGLALVFPKQYHEPRKWNDKYDEVPAVTADIYILDRQDMQTGREVRLHDSMVFGKVMVGQLKAAMEAGPDPMLGRIGQVPSDKGNPAWKFLPWNPGDEVMADQYLLANPRNSFSQPQGQQQQAPPSQPAWPGAAPAPQPSAPAWGAPPPQPQQQALPAQSAAPAWGAPAAPPPPAADPWPNSPGLAEFLRSRGVDIAQVPSEDAARQLASSFPAG